MLSLHQAAASYIKPLASCINQLVSQWKASLHNNDDFATAYLKIFSPEAMEEYGLWSSTDYMYDEKTNLTLANEQNATSD